MYSYPNSSSPPMGGQRYPPHSREPPHTPRQSGPPRLPTPSEDAGERQSMRRPPFAPPGTPGFNDGHTSGAGNRSPLGYGGFTNRTERTRRVPRQDQGCSSTIDDSTSPRQLTSSSHGRYPNDNLTPRTPYSPHQPASSPQVPWQAQFGDPTVSARDLFIAGIEANRSASSSNNLIPPGNIDDDVGVTSTEEAFLYHGKIPFVPDAAIAQSHWPGTTDGGQEPNINLPNASLLSPYRYHQGQGTGSEAGASTATSSRSGRPGRRGRPRQGKSPRRYHCNDCEDPRSSFGSRKDLRRHRESVHTQERKHVCYTCGYKTARKDNFDRHKRSCTRSAQAHNENDSDNDDDGYGDQHDQHNTRDRYHAQDQYLPQDPYLPRDQYQSQDPYHAQDQYYQDKPQDPYQLQDQNDQMEHTDWLPPYNTPPHFEFDDLASSYD